MHLVVENEKLDVLSVFLEKGNSAEENFSRLKPLSRWAKCKVT